MSQVTLLLIDSDVTALARLGEQLTAAGYQVLKASEASHGALLFDEQRPAMVLLEVSTSRGAGWELLPRLALEAPVIVVSEQGLEEDVVRALDAGAIDVIPKPFRSAELLARVRVRLAGAGHPTPVAQPVLLTQTAVLAPVATSATPIEPPAPAARASRRSEEAAASVFMDDAAERALLAEQAQFAQQSEPTPATSNGEEDAPLGKRLHAARQRRRITLVQAESDLNIRMYYLQAIEEEKFTLLPSGALTETFLVRYASYLGQNADRARDEYRRLHYSSPSLPPPALGGLALRRGIPRWLVWLLAILLAVLVSVGALLLFDPHGASTLVESLRGLLGLR